MNQDWTMIIRPHHSPKTVISEEYSTEYKEGMEPFYPVNDERNNALTDAYRKLAHQEGVMFPEDKYNIGWYKITFKPRQGGVNSINMKRIIKIGWKALGDFRSINKNLQGKLS